MKKKERKMHHPVSTVTARREAAKKLQRGPEIADDHVGDPNWVIGYLRARLEHIDEMLRMKQRTFKDKNEVTEYVAEELNVMCQRIRLFENLRNKNVDEIVIRR